MRSRPLKNSREKGPTALTAGRGVLLTAAWLLSVLAVVWGSLTPLAAPVLDAPQADKVLHFFAYGWLALLSILAQGVGHRGIAAAASMFLLGVALEVAQQFAPYRSCSLGDVAADGLGVLAGTAIGYIFPWSETRK